MPRQSHDTPLPHEESLAGEAGNHPKDPRHPTTWHARDYGLITANPFGGNYFKSKQGKLTVENGKNVTFSYRFFFHEGAQREADIPKALQGLGEVRIQL